MDKRKIEASEIFLIDKVSIAAWKANKAVKAANNRKAAQKGETATKVKAKRAKAKAVTPASKASDSYEESIG